MRPAVRLTALAFVTLLGAGCSGDQRIVSPGDPPTNGRVDGGYTPDELAYFSDGVGPTGVPDSLRKYLSDTVVAKWRGDLRVEIVGSTTAADTAFLDVVCKELTAAIGGPIRVVRDTGTAVNVTFVIVPDAGRQIGGRWYTDSAGYIEAALIGVGDGYVNDDRHRLIRLQMMHALGFAYHSHRVPGAMLYDEDSTNPEFLSVDRAAIEMLYRDEVKVGMTNYVAQTVLGTLLRRP